jgi:hypothetical protein
MARSRELRTRQRAKSPGLSTCVLVLLVLSLGLGGTTSGAEVLKRYVIPGEGISLSLPRSWRAIDYRQVRSRNRDAVARFVRGDPDFYAPIEALGNPKSPFRFMAINPRVDFRTPDDRAIRTSMNVLVTPAAAGLTFDRYRQNVVAGIRRLLPRDAVMIDDVVVLGGKRAVRSRVTYRRQVGSVTLTLYDEQYSFLRPGRSIHITYETPKRVATRYAAAFRASAASITIH